MIEIKDGGPAFARSSQSAIGELDMAFGLSRRDYFAAAALTGILAHGSSTPRSSDIHPPYCVEASIVIADWMLKELDKQV